ncbi:MAG: hypothetical protein LBN97_05010, partial [Oscillospiraceae bacterium]|nr:hypothetical protein [Oscillospiraceae bacterium]
MKTRMAKRLTAFLMVFLLVFNIAANDIAVFANDTEPETPDLALFEAFIDERTISRDEELNGDVTYSGIINSENGAAIRVLGGKLTLLRTTVVNCDIYLENNAVLRIDGTVNGTVFVNSTSTPANVIGWNGSIERENNLYCESSSYVRELIFNNRAGFGQIAGSVGAARYTNVYSGEMILTRGSEADSVYFDSNGHAWFDGHVSKLYQSAGDLNANTGGKIDAVYTSNSANFYINAGASVKLLHHGSSGAMWSGTKYDESTGRYGKVDTLILDGEQAKFSNDGVITNLIVYGGEFHNQGFVENAYVDDCTSFSSIQDSRVNLGERYIIKNLLARNVGNFGLNGLQGNMNSGRLYGSVTLDGVSGGFFDIIIENAVLTGQIDGLAI